MTDHASLPTDIARRIDAVCLEFEEAWRTEDHPRLEDYLGRWNEPATHRGQLFEELLRVELEAGKKSDLRLTVHHYRDRFPGYVDAVQKVFAQQSHDIDSRELSATVTAGPAGLDDVGDLLKHFFR